MATPLHTIRRLARQRLMEIYALTTPGSPLVSPQGTPGATTVRYKITAVNAVGESDASQAGVTTTSAATLNGTNFNRLTWTAVPGAVSYNVYRTTAPTNPATTGKIGNTANTTLDDTGLAGDSSTEPAVNTSGITAPFWTEDELLQILIMGCKDLWRAIIDLHQNHFSVDDATNVSISANTGSLTGVPSRCFRVLMIEPRDLTDSGDGRNVIFKPRPYNSLGFQAARSVSAVDPASWGNVIYYDLLNAGSPVTTPSIVISPQLSSALNLRLVYVATLDPNLAETDNNPIPGESDNALIAWTVAYARAKDREDRMPDPAWLSVYATDKQSLLTALTPRQEQEEEYVMGMFEPEGWWY